MNLTPVKKAKATIAVVTLAACFDVSLNKSLAQSFVGCKGFKGTNFHQFQNGWAGSCATAVSNFPGG